MYHIEFQMGGGGTNDRKHLNVWHGVNLISIRDALITRTIYIPLSEQHSNHFQFWQGRK